MAAVCRYLCKLSDQELRQSAARNMADLMWSTVKEPLDSTLCFDKESLDLAFKYFMSPTLTMRLAGLSQITVSPGLCFYFERAPRSLMSRLLRQNQLHTFNDVCNNESLVSDTETYVSSVHAPRPRAGVPAQTCALAVSVPPGPSPKSWPTG